jgi:hypothetical protein
MIQRVTMQVRFSNGDVEQYEDTFRGGGLQGDIYWPAKPGGYAKGERPSHVVKLYKYDPSKTAQIRLLEERVDKLIKDYNPTTSDSYWREFFAWPEKKVTSPRIGFRMPWADRMRRMDEYIYDFPAYWEDFKPEERGWFIGRLVIAMKLALAADRLARMGLCYADFSHRNVMVDPFEGRMMLIDCDALTIPGVIPPDVAGTKGYQAPEIVAHNAPPRIETDRHALAALFYRWFLGHLPLEGDHPMYSLDDNEDYRSQFGDKAIYIENPTDDSNRWKRQIYHASILGPELADLFRDTFVDGLLVPNKRPQPRRWADALMHAYDRVIPCASPKCDWRFFIAYPRPGLACPMCGESVTAVKSLPRIFIQKHKTTTTPDDYEENTSGQHFVVGWPGRSLYDWHIRNLSPFHADNKEPDRAPRAAFEYSAAKDSWFITNESGLVMRFRHEDSAPWEYWATGARLKIHDNMRIQFGDTPAHNRALVKIDRLNP